MMYSFILLSLVVAVYCHQPVPELYDADKYEAKVKRLDEVEELIDRVTTRIQNLKDKRELRQKQKDDADRRSKSILLRLDRMKLNDGSFHCDKPDKEFKCRKNTQCVNNILVCDNVPDCEDKSDEDPDLCRLPFEIGSVWSGLNVFYDCLTDTSKGDTGVIYISVKFERSVRSTAVPSTIKVWIIFFWNYGTTRVLTYRTSGVYYYGKQTLVVPIYYSGIHMIHLFKATDEGRAIYFDNYRTKILCGQSVVFQNAEYKLGRNFV